VVIWCSLLSVSDVHQLYEVYRLAATVRLTRLPAAVCRTQGQPAAQLRTTSASASATTPRNIDDDISFLHLLTFSRLHQHVQTDTGTLLILLTTTATPV